MTSTNNDAPDGEMKPPPARVTGPEGEKDEEDAGSSSDIEMEGKSKPNILLKLKREKNV